MVTADRRFSLQKLTPRSSPESSSVPSTVDVTAMDQTGTNNTIQNNSSENKLSGNSDANGETRRGNFSPFILLFWNIAQTKVFHR
jgi:hypothetical protein